MDANVYTIVGAVAAVVGIIYLISCIKNKKDHDDSMSNW